MINKLRVTSIVFNNFKNDSRVLKEAISLQSNGFSVNVVALHEDPLEEREKLGDVLVHRIKLTTRKWSKNTFVQIFKYIEFLFRFCKEYRNSDILHCNDLGTLPVGVFVKFLFNRKVKIVYDAHEYEIHILSNQSQRSIKLAFYLERFLIKYADKVITVSDSIANEYVRLYGISKPVIVLNCPSYVNAPKHDLFRKELGIRQDQTIFLYQGGLSKSRGIEMLIEAFTTANDDKNVIVFMGYGPLESNIRKHAEIHNKIFFKQAVSPKILLEYTASADYGILFYEDSCLNHRYCSPNKMFEYLMAGIPIVTSNLVEIKKIVQQYSVGIVAEINTNSGFIDAIEKIKKLNHNLLLNNVDQARKIFTWEAQEKVLLQAYEEM